MTIRDVFETAHKNQCVVFVDGNRYEVTSAVGEVAQIWETLDRYGDDEDADLSFPADTPVRIVAGCAVVTGEDGNDYSIELYQLAKFPIA